MRAIRIESGQLHTDDRWVGPAPEAGDAIVRPTLMGIGASDIAVATGRIAHEGVLGHEFVGVVEHAPDDARITAGQRVVGSISAVCGVCDMCRAGLSNHCRNRRVLGLHKMHGCFSETFAIPARNLAAVPDSVPDDAAVLAEPIAAALHAAHVVRVEGKPYVTVLGDGITGLLTAQVLAALNASVRVLGKHQSKFGRAEKWGVKHRHVDEVGRLQDQDVVVDCTGSPEGFALAMQLVRPRGKIIARSAPAPIPNLDSAATRVAVDTTPIVVNELEVIGARCGKVAEAVAALQAGTLDLDGLITRRGKLAEARSALEAAMTPDQIRVVIEA